MDSNATHERDSPLIPTLGSLDDFEGFIDATITIEACDVVNLMSLAAATAGARSASLYVADYGLTWLQRVGVDGPDGNALPLASTPAGRAFIDQRPVIDPDHPGTVWMPLADGSDRTGVLEIVADATTRAELRRLERVTRVVGLVLTSQRRFSDLIERCRRARPLSRTAEMQWGLLPPLSCETSHISISGILEPAYEAGGDSFDYALNHHTVHIAVIDAVGHGMAAMLMSTSAINSLRNARRQGHSLETAYLDTGTVIASQFGNSNFVTGQVASIDVATGTMYWINAGHPLPIRIRDGIASELTCRASMPMGLGGAIAEVAVDQLEPDDRILFHTDGVIESRPVGGVQFGSDSLLARLITATTNEMSAAETVRQLANDVLTHVNGPLADDASLLLIDYKGPPQTEAVGPPRNRVS